MNFNKYLILILVLTGLNLLNLKAQSLSEGFQTNNFIENKGQIADSEGNPHNEVFYKANTGNASLFFTKNGIIYLFNKFEIIPNEASEKEKSMGNFTHAKILETKPLICRMDLHFLNTNPDFRIIPSAKRTETSNFYLAHCPEGIMNVAHFNKITYENIYDNIDVDYYFTDKGLKYDIIVKPGGHIEDIKFEYLGANNVMKNEKGQLIINYADGQLLTEEAPVIFYDNELNKNFNLEYSINLKSKVIGFTANKSYFEKTLVIDPAIIWATYFHNTNSANSNWTNPEYDSNGNLFMAAQTYDNAFPLQNPGGTAWYDATKTTMIKVVVMKFNINKTLIWSTYYGGDETDCLAGCTDYGKALALDNTGNVYIAGYTYSGTTVFPTYNPGGCFYQDQSKCYGETSFFLKFNNNGVRQWASMFQHEQGNTNGTMMRVNGITCDGDNLYFTGQQYNWYPANTIPLRNPGGLAHYQTTILGDQDVFVGRFTSSSVLNWCTYLHSTNVANTAYGQGLDLHCDASGNLFLTGRESGANSHHYLINPGSAYYQSTKGANGDLFITKFNTSLTAVWGTYYGGNGMDIPSTVEPDALGNIYIMGRYTASTDFPVLDPGGSALYQGSKSNAACDGFLLKFNASTCERKWATYLGANVPTAGSDENHFSGIAFNNSNNNIMLSGYSKSTSMTTVNQTGSYNQASNAGDYDMFYYELNSSGVVQWASYYGQTLQETAYNGRLGSYASPCGLKFQSVITSTSTNLSGVDPGNGAWYQGTTTFSYNDFLFEMGNITSPLPVSVSISASANPICSGTNVIFTALPVNGGPSPTYQWFLNGNPVPGGSTYSNASLSNGDQVYCQMTTSLGCTTGSPANSNIITITINTNSIAATSLLTSPASVCPGASSTLTVNGGSLGSGATWQLYDNNCGGNLISSNATGIFTVSPSSSTTYYVQASGTCNTTTCVNNTVNVNTASTVPTSLQSSPTSVCAGNPSTLTVNGGSLGTGATWQLYDNNCGGNLISSNATGIFTVTPSSTTTYYVHASGTCNTTTCVSSTVNVNTASTAPVSLQSVPTSVCAGTPSTLTVNGGSLGSGATWQLYDNNCGGNLVASNSTGIFTVTPSTTTTYYVQATGACNTTTCVSSTINVNTISTSPASLSTVPSSVCSGSASTLTVNGGFLGTGATWQLYDNNCGGNLVSSNSTGIFTVTPSTTTTYYVQASGTCNTTSCVNGTVTVNTASSTPASLSSSPSSVCSGDPSTLTVNGGSLGTGATWQLYDNNCGGNLISSNSTGLFTVTPSTTTTYYVQASGTCNTTTCVSETVNVNGVSTAPTSLTIFPTSICSGTSATLTVNGGLLGTGATWKLFDNYCGGNLLSSNSTGVFTVMPTSSTSYFVQASGPCDTTSCVSAILTVNQSSTPPTSLSANPSSVCSGSSSTLTVMGGSLGTGATWMLYSDSCNGALVSSNTTGTFNVTPTTSTTYFVKAAGFCDTTLCVSQTVSITPLPANAGQINGPVSVCQGIDNVSYSVPVIADATSYIWSLPSGFNGSSNTNTINLSLDTNATSGVITVYGSNACGNGLISSISVTVNPHPIVYFSDSIEPLCLNAAPLTLTGGIPIGGSYSGPHTSNNIFNPQSASAGLYNILYSYTNNQGCTDTASYIIQVLPLPIVTLDSFENICINAAPLTLNGGYPQGGAYFGSNVNANIFNPSVAGTGLHAVYYTYTDSNGCSDTTQSNIFVSPEVSLSCDAPDNSIFYNLGTTVNISASPVNQGIYQFYIGNTLMQTSSSNIFSTNALDNTSIVYVVLNNTCNDSLTINFKPIPNAFTPLSKDGSNDIFMPNVDLKIINRWGQEIYKGTDGWDGTYNGEAVSPGTYFYIINISGGNSEDKFINGIVTLIKK